MRIDQAAALAVGAFGLAFIGGMVTGGEPPDPTRPVAAQTVMEDGQLAEVDFGGANGVPALGAAPKPKATPAPKPKPKVKPEPKPKPRKVTRSAAGPSPAPAVSGVGGSSLLTGLAPSPKPKPKPKPVRRNPPAPRPTPEPQTIAEPVKTAVPDASFDDQGEATTGDFDFGGAP